MKLLFDLIATQPCGESKFHGGGEYAKIVFKHLVAKADAGSLACFYDSGLELDEEIRDLTERNRIELIALSTNEELSGLLNKGNYSVFYSALPYRYHDLKIERADVKLIYTIHGLREIELPTDRYEGKYRQGVSEKMKFVLKSLFGASYIRHKKEQIEKLLKSKAPLEIVVPSFHTKYSLINYFPEFDASNVKVMYSPRKTEESDKFFDLSPYGVEPRGYFLLISGNRWLKNGYRAIRALDEIYGAFRTNVKTVVLGVKNSDMYKKAIRNPEQFVFLDYVSSEQLDFFYRQAFCFVYPTLNEGFGYPPLEGMRHETPVIASSITSISEVCRDGVIYFNPFSIEEMKNRIISVLFDSDIRETYARRGREVYEAVSSKQDEDLDRLIGLLLGEERISEPAGGKDPELEELEKAFVV